MMIRSLRVATAGLAVVLAAAVWAPSALAAPGGVFSCKGGQRFALRSTVNWTYVSAELSRPGLSRGMLRARATTVGPWETFQCVQHAGRTYFLSTATDRWVSAEISRSGDKYGMLRARATTLGPWEQFRVVSLLHDPDPNRPRDIVNIYSVANDLAVSAEFGWSGDGAGTLRARATDPYTWELFSVEWLPVEAFDRNRL
jgi:hypothetical protein